MKSSEYRLAAIMFTDIVGFSGMMEADEQSTLKLLIEHNRIVSEAAAEYRGSVIKTIGDAFLIDFPNTVQAVQAGVDILDRIHAWNVKRGGQKMELRIGIHLGDIHFFEDDALGEGINIASRLQAVAAPGKIAISHDVYNMVANKVKVPIVSRGEMELKNIRRPIEVYEISVNVPEDAAADRAAPAAQQPAAGDTGKAGDTDGQAESGQTADGSGGTTGQQRDALLELVRSTILSEIKVRRRRIHMQEALELFPEADEDIRDALERIAAKGLIARDRGAGEASGSGDARAGETGGRETRASSDARGGDASGSDASGSAQRGPATGSGSEGDIISRIGSALREAGILGGGPATPEGETEYIRRYRSKVEQQAARERSGLVGHLGSFVGVNAMLFIINMTTSPGFPWFLFPLFGWGIGILNHINEVKRKQDAVRHLEALPNLDRKGLKLLQEYEQARTGYSSHLVSTAGTSALLLVINLVTGPGFMWSLIPIGAMGIGMVAHIAGFPGKIRKIRRRMERAGMHVPSLPLFRPVRRLPKPSEEGYTRTQQAKIIRSVIQGQYKRAVKSGAPIGKDFLPLLDRYVEQIETLEGRCSEVEGLIRSIPSANLQEDLVKLKRRRSQTADPKLEAEYNESIQQIEKHNASYRQLINQQEMLELRLNSALNSLKQLQIDLVRVQSMSNAQDSTLLEDLQGRSEDLNHYLSDVDRSFAELK